MTDEVFVKTHLIVTDVHEEYNINWCGKIAESKPLIKEGLPVFVIIGDHRRAELNTIDIKRLEECAKKMTAPRGRESTTSDSSRIYIKEENGNEKLVCVVTHFHIKKYSQMYDKVGYR